jgi:hypothetical protein
MQAEFTQLEDPQSTNGVRPMGISIDRKSQIDIINGRVRFGNVEHLQQPGK